MTGLGSEPPKLLPKQHEEDVPPKLPPRANKRMNEPLPRPPKNLPLPKPPKDYDDPEDDILVDSPMLPLPPKFLPNEDGRVTEQDPPPRPPKLLPVPLNENRRVNEPDLPPRSPRSPITKPMVWH